MWPPIALCLVLMHVEFICTTLHKMCPRLAACHVAGSMHVPLAAAQLEKARAMGQALNRVRTILSAWPAAVLKAWK